MTPAAARGRLLLWSVAGGVVLVLAYLAMVRLGIGQRIDFSAFEGRKWTNYWMRRRQTAAVHWLTPLTLAVVVAGSIATAARTRGWLAAAGTALPVPATLMIARGLKQVLPRAELLPDSWISSSNTYPSGHTGALMAAVLAAVTVSSPGRRPVVAAVGAAGVALHSLAMSGTGWHRPSDVVGGIALAVAVAGSSALAVVGRWRPVTRSVMPWRLVGPASPWFRGPVAAGLVVATVTAAALTWNVLLRLFGGTNYGSYTAHVGLAVGVVGLAASAVALHARLVDDVDRATEDQPAVRVDGVGSASG